MFFLIFAVIPAMMALFVHYSQGGPGPAKLVFAVHVVNHSEDVVIGGELFTYGLPK